MKIDTKFFLIFIMSAVFSWQLLNIWESHDYLALYKGLPLYLDYIKIPVYYFWFACISFYFVGVIEDYLSGYGVLLIVRNYSLPKLVLRLFSKVFIELNAIVSFQFVIYIFISVITKKSILEFSMIEFIKSYIIYILTIYLLILIQLLLEMYVKAQVAMLITNVYAVSSILIGSMLFEIEKGYIFLYLLIPNFAMAARTTIFNQNSFSIYLPSVIVLISIIISGIIFVSIEKIKIKDIF
jgi:hypothetical protein